MPGARLRSLLAGDEKKPREARRPVAHGSWYHNLSKSSLTCRADPLVRKRPPGRVRQGCGSAVLVGPTPSSARGHLVALGLRLAALWDRRPRLSSACRSAFFRSLLGIALLAVCLAGPAWAQRGRGRVRHDAPLEEFQRMTPEERERAMANLPPARRKKLQRQLKIYDGLTAAQKSQLDWFNHLSPERQEAFRKVYKKFVNEPPERRQMIRDEMSRLTTLPRQEREARLSSPELRARFSKNEQQILGQMSDALPRE